MLPTSVNDYFRLKTILVALPFFYLGIILKEYRNALFEKLKWYHGLVLVVTASVLAMMNSKVTFSAGEFANPFVTSISVLVFTLGFFVLFYDLENKLGKTIIYKFLVFIGKKTIVILCTHKILILFIRVIEKVLNIQTHSFPVIAAFAIVVIGEVILIKILNKIKNRKILILFGK